MNRLALGFITTFSLALSVSAQAQTLRGSSGSVERQNNLAVAYGFTFVQSYRHVSNLVDDGQLIRVRPTSDMELHDVSYPYARPGVKLFIDRLSSQYRNACGEKLTVTSLLRPVDQQPPNAVARSVHPAGMAVDLRVPRARSCRTWLERTLLSLEGKGVLDVTRERRPPHYHVAVFVENYENYVASMAGGTSQYVVRRGDTLSEIAKLTGVSVAQLRAANSLRGDMIRVGQELEIPAFASQGTATSSTRELVRISQVTHKVRRGDTLWRIGNRYGASVSQIMSENGLEDDLLQVGQELKISTSR